MPETTEPREAGGVLPAPIPIASIPLKERPTVHRIAETLLKLEEDVLGEGLFPTARSLTVRFGEPVRVRGFLEKSGLTVKKAVAPLTELLADGIQSMLEELTSEDRLS